MRAYSVQITNALLLACYAIILTSCQQHSGNSDVKDDNVIENPFSRPISELIVDSTQKKLRTDDTYQIQYSEEDLDILVETIEPKTMARIVTAFGETFRETRYLQQTKTFEGLNLNKNEKYIFIELYLFHKKSFSGTKQGSYKSLILIEDENIEDDINSNVLLISHDNYELLRKITTEDDRIEEPLLWLDLDHTAVWILIGEYTGENGLSKYSAIHFSPNHTKQLGNRIRELVEIVSSKVDFADFLLKLNDPGGNQ
jgi:hypothetical protein